MKMLMTTSAVPATMLCVFTCLLLSTSSAKTFRGAARFGFKRFEDIVCRVEDLSGRVISEYECEGDGVCAGRPHRTIRGGNVVLASYCKDAMEYLPGEAGSGDDESLLPVSVHNDPSSHSKFSHSPPTSSSSSFSSPSSSSSSSVLTSKSRRSGYVGRMKREAGTDPLSVESKQSSPGTNIHTRTSGTGSEPAHSSPRSRSWSRLSVAFNVSQEQEEQELEDVPEGSTKEQGEVEEVEEIEDGEGSGYIQDPPAFTSSKPKHKLLRKMHTYASNPARRTIYWHRLD